MHPESVEIERKFLVVNDTWRLGASGIPCRQGYLLATAACAVRVRTMGVRAYLTIKAPTVGLRRQELEYPIPMADAALLLAGKFLVGSVVEKTRYLLRHAGRDWEVDEYHGANRGLVVAEIELSDEADEVALPPWVGEDISHDSRYYNANLAQVPYGEWPSARS
jgi:CYTH domain-containing protein